MLLAGDDHGETTSPPDRFGEIGIAHIPHPFCVISSEFTRVVIFLFSLV
jgi:hypothetical protein